MTKLNSIKVYKYVAKIVVDVNLVQSFLIFFADNLIFLPNSSLFCYRIKFIDFFKFFAKWDLCYYVTYAFQSEFTLYRWLNVKELLAQNRRYIWSLSDSKRVQTHNHLVLKQTLNHLAKWLRVRLSTKLLWVPILLLSQILQFIPQVWPFKTWQVSNNP